MKGILGRKAGMTQVFIDDGKSIPVTVIEVKPNTVLEVKTADKHGYDAVKLGYEDKKDNKANKAELGIAKKANTSAKYFIKEIRNMEGEFNLGDTVDASIFEAGEYVDVTGISKGKGFQGSIKRHNQSRGPMKHGSKSHRVTGSLGDIRGTVKKTKKMPGHMGHVQVTQQNLVIIDVDLENNVILVKGSIPGPNKSFVVIKDSVKLEEAMEAHKLVNIKEEQMKNELLEEGKKFGAELNTQMSIEEMKDIIKEAEAKKAEDDKKMEELKAKAEELKISNFQTMSLEELEDAVAKGESVAAAKEAPAAEEKPAEAEEAPAEEAKEEEAE
jgi:large subunit ribosomal protein L3